ncbi:Hypothetical_protein [Hexamita inflata]|uniref:Hypothetical_protein n=1 Tax=Hexamita inflata TaxID=28002 RepID=A0AA86REW3_9EUKA|nr:Hypothetical protein HINF_LOCUS64804 [Hexamita inflata]
MKCISPMLKQITVSRSPSASNAQQTQKHILSYPMNSKLLTAYQDGNFSFEVNNNNISTDFLVVNKKQNLILRLKTENKELRALVNYSEKLEIYLAHHSDNMQCLANNARLIKNYIKNLKDLIQKQ